MKTFSDISRPTVEHMWCIMSRDWRDSFSKQSNYFDVRNVKIHSNERTYSSDTSNTIERETTAVSHDGQTYFYADSKSCKVQSNDPSDLYRALDITFKAKPSIFGKLITAINTLLGYSFEEDDATALVNSEKNRFNKCNSKPKM
ncbi:hypothetical protein HA402_011321 [Bradysia odoriphaga]|nr:hypothetical protein HA402_011321 [Bradysia odoriphaga]